MKLLLETSAKYRKMIRASKVFGRTGKFVKKERPIRSLGVLARPYINCDMYNIFGYDEDKDVAPYLNV